VASSVHLHERESARVAVLTGDLALHFPLRVLRALELFGEASLQGVGNGFEALIVADVVGLEPEVIIKLHRGPGNNMHTVPSNMIVRTPASMTV
jgi:hypothetical protein